MIAYGINILIRNRFRRSRLHYLDGSFRKYDVMTEEKNLYIR